MSSELRVKSENEAVRRFLPHLLLGILCILLWSATMTIPSWRHPVIRADAGDVLYAGVFAGDAASPFNREWSQYGGRLTAGVVDDALQITIEPADSGAYSLLRHRFADFDLHVTARALAGSIDNAFGVVFRLRTNADAAPDDDSYYLFLISSDGYYRLVRAIGGAVQIVSDWIPSPAIRLGLGETNALRVLAVGDRFAFHINNQPVSLCLPDNDDGQSTFFNGECIGGRMVETWQDASIPDGQIGVAALSTVSGGGGIAIAFDRVVVLQSQ